MATGATSPKIWIVSTGTEILQGLYPDTNAQWLSQELLAMGFPVARQIVLPDAPRALTEELTAAAQRCDLIVMTGGLGPTADDLNREVVARIFKVALIEDARALRDIERQAARRGRKVTASDERQALLPEGGRILYNPWGTAPGFYLRPPDESGVRASMLALPGPPREMKPMFREMAARHVIDQFGQGGGAIRTLTINTVGIREALINERIEDLFGSDPNVNVALLAGNWRVNVRLTIRGENDDEVRALEQRWRRLIRERLGDEAVWGENEANFARVVGRLLRERGQTLALAESCTGGLIAKQITDVPGSSDYLLEGFVTYSNQAKTRSLGVSESLLRDRGAVSAEVARAMAVGAKKASGSDWALGVTGIAGPGGGGEAKPVGLIYFGLVSPTGEVGDHKIQGIGEREAVRDQSALAGLNLLRRAILGLP